MLCVLPTGAHPTDCPYQNHQVGLQPTTTAVAYQNAGGPGRNTTSSNTGQTNPVPSSRHISRSKSAYLPAMIFGRKRWCLLDTGSEVSVIPARYVPTNVITPSVRSLNAANGSSIPVTGETNLLLDLGDQSLRVPCLVSEHVDEILLGLTFLEENRCVWHFADRSIQIRGHGYRLYAHKVTWSVRRVTLQEDTTVAPRCQQNLMAQTIYRTLAPSNNPWVSKPFEVAPGLRLARTMVADRPSNVVMQIVNTNDEEVRLPKGTCLGNLEEVVPVVGEPSDEDNADSFSHIENVIDGVDESLSSEHRTDFRQLILKHSDVFSK